MRLSATGELNPHSTHNRPSSARIMLRAQSGGMIRSSMPAMAVPLYGGQYYPERPWSSSGVPHTQLV
jgi:hypothetical protein